MKLLETKLTRTDEGEKITATIEMERKSWQVFHKLFNLPYIRRPEPPLAANYNKSTEPGNERKPFFLP